MAFAISALRYYGLRKTLAVLVGTKTTSHFWAVAQAALASEEPLFKRIAPMSGTFLAVRPTSLTAQEGIYWQTAKHLGLDRLSAADRLDALDKIPGLDLVAKMPPFIPFALVIDGDFCHDRPTFASLAEGLSSRSGQTWCKDICIGDCGFDVGNDPSTILRAYGIQADPNLTAKEEVANDNFIKILTFCQDIVFRAPSITIARQWSTGSAYVYHFNESNPWDGPWKGYASHTLDIAFLSQNFNGHLGLPLQELTKMLGADILRFVHGQASWQDFKAYEKKWTMRVYGPDAKIDLRSEGEIRDAAIWELIDVFGADDLLDATENFLKGE
ncbi:hypothetical protein LCI18_004382 [Fusarium solani-melongenae]|uniref:Uncharacterized protein n=1 Tax=Fusarium solani subsp. cucurbitae TaxID=2747967 RepID=A0ACD3YWV0_FUSSC|nr:hypothetical protein LCI18_004382 [Fusarium solani-melongenae]